MLRNEKGFTLIELLIVIVIIGILAGVLISVIDPTGQQNRARDAGIEASINKVVLATEGYISSYGQAPDEVQFLGQFKNGTVTDAAATCAAAAGLECLFEVGGNTIPPTCASGAGATWYGNGTSSCAYRYEVVDMAAGQFRIWAKSAGLTDRIFVFQNYSGGGGGAVPGQIVHCDATDGTGDPSGCVAL